MASAGRRIEGTAMSMIKFTENFEDLSTDQGYQFKFFCDKCRNGYMSSFQTSTLGAAGSVLRAAGSLFGGVFGSAANSTYDIQRAVGGKAHDDALRDAVEEVRAQFHQCKRCGKWVCPENCWNGERGLCNECAPDIQMELASAQVAATVEQINTKVRELDLTKDIHLGATAAATCPKCGAKAKGKFCPDCGTTMVAQATCGGCGAAVAAGVKFCPECGQPMQAAKPKCPGCAKEFEKAPKFCDDCGTKIA
jgi:DNA-directed RNA polymerase subunit M/transcription elongation factor TFIIS